jgi:acyl-coenzyme A synthetase/AMP-(fatty) acid ligase
MGSGASLDRAHAQRAARPGLALLAPRPLAAPLAWAGGVPITARRFLADVRAQAALLDDAAPVVDLCANRYRFAVVLAAAWSRGAPCLLPPNALPDTLRRLQARWPDLAIAKDVANDVANDVATDGAQAASDGLPRIRLAACALDAGTPADACESVHDDVPALAPDLPVACLLTSGSTGEPQPHVKRWGPLVRNARAGAERLAALAGLPAFRGLAGVAVVATVPPQHSYGLESSVMIALQGGASFEAARPFYPADVVAALERVPRPRALVTTPFHLHALLQSTLALPPVDFVLSATAPLSPGLARVAEARFGAPLLEIYGSTETCQVASRRTAREETWQTFGELRIHAERTRGANGDGHDDEGDSDGDGHERFWASGGHLEAPTPLADALQLVDERRFRLLGRADDVVQIAGKRSSLAHLDHHLRSLPGVRDGAFWLPEAAPGAIARTTAFVVAPGVEPATLLAGLRERIDPAFLPRRIVFVEALPRATTGKLARQALAELARAQRDAEDR